MNNEFDIWFETPKNGVAPYQELHRAVMERDDYSVELLLKRAFQEGQDSQQGA